MNILFLGDSITDCDHCFTRDNLGNGFVKITQQLLLEQYGEPVLAVNGGTDGFTLPRIYRKWLAHYSGTEYDAAVILGGINEVGMVMEAGCAETERREFLENSGNFLRKLLAGLCEDGCGQILVLEPFLFQSPAFLQAWVPCLEELRRMIRRTVSDFAASSPHIRYLPTQNLLRQEADRLSPAPISPDGIHLTAAGHTCLARLLLQNLR